MKRALALVLVLALAGCAGTRRRAGAREARPAEAERARFAQAPFAGMTKAEALARYGEPRRRILTEGGERWYYYLNAGEVLRKTLNPLVLTPPRYRRGVLLFGADGRVRRFAWEAKEGR